MATSPGTRLSTIRLTTAQGWIIRAWATWTVYVWTTRMWNIWRVGADDAVSAAQKTIGFKVVHTVLAIISVGFAVAGVLIVERGRKAAAAEAAAPVAAVLPAAEEPLASR